MFGAILISLSVWSEIMVQQRTIRQLVTHQAVVLVELDLQLHWIPLMHVRLRHTAVLHARILAVKCDSLLASLLPWNSTCRVSALAEFAENA